jgi:2-keto-4-pentenoate hydratase
MQPDSIERAADTLAAAWRGHERIDALPEDCRPATAEEGFAIQQALNRRLGYETAGWKLAHSSLPAMARIGVTTPPPGRLFAQTVKNTPATFGAGELHAPRLEPEFAFLLAHDLTLGDGPCTENQAAAAVADLYLAIEIADSRYLDPKAVGIPGAIADNMGTGGFIVGPVVAEWRNADLRSGPVRLLVDGAVAAEQMAPEDRCDPLWVLAEAATNLARHGEALRAGHYISTGAHVTPHPVPLGHVVVADFGDLGQVRVTLEE